MKIYARVGKRYTTNQAKGNAMVSCGLTKYIEMTEWKKLGYIPHIQVIPNDIQEYNKIKKELQEKNLIK
jgi:hypothetical protein